MPSSGVPLSATDIERQCIVDEQRVEVLLHLKGSAMGFVDTLRIAKTRTEASMDRYLRAFQDFEREHQRLVLFAEFVEMYLTFVARAEAGDVSDDVLGEMSLYIQALTEGV